MNFTEFTSLQTTNFNENSCSRIILAYHWAFHSIRIRKDKYPHQSMTIFNFFKYFNHLTYVDHQLQNNYWQILHGVLTLLWTPTWAPPSPSPPPIVAQSPHTVAQSISPTPPQEILVHDLKKVKTVRLFTNAEVLNLQQIFCKQASHPFLIPKKLYKQQHC